jgi:predicted outer membrane lipoprotein
VASWIVSIGLALAFAVLGAMKLALSKEQLVLSGADWADDFGPGTVRFVGMTEVLGALGMILPAVPDIPRWLALTAAAAGLIVVVLGAAAVHARRREASMIALNFALLALAAIAVWFRSSH